MLKNFYYDLVNRKPVPIIADSEEECYEKVEKILCDNRKRQIRQRYFGDVRVSTVFLSINHDYRTGEGGDDYQPTVFETMILGGEHGGYMTRCKTHRQALAMHKQAIALVKGKRSA